MAPPYPSLLKKKDAKDLKLKFKSSDGDSSENSSYAYELPDNIWMDILGRLPLKTLFDCMCVRKSWRSILTETYFYRLYSHHMPTTLILRSNVMLGTLNKIHLIDLDESCAVVDAREISMRPLTSRLNHDINIQQSSSSSSLPLDLQLEYGNGCNGLVCLNDIQTREPNIIWNPIMGQYVILPKSLTKAVDKVVAGFGYCGESNRYIILRIFHVNRDYSSSKQMVEIYHLGMVGNKWRKIEDAPFLIPSRCPGFYINNSLHWILHYHGTNIYDQEKNMSSNNSELIGRFDLVDENFKPVKAPPIYSSDKKNKYYWSNLGIIGSCLSICAIDAEVLRPDSQVWVMEEYDVPESWALKFSIRAPTVEWWDPYCWTQANKFRNNEVILIVCANTYSLYNLRERRFQAKRFLNFRAIAHVPSFISLEDVLSGGSLDVRYV